MRSRLQEVIFPEPEVEVEVTKPDEEFEAFLLSMKDCLQSLGGATPSRTRAGSPLVAERHAKYKPQKKYLDSGKDAKDSCPFARNDSNPNAREIRPATARVRVHVNPAVAATGRAGAKDRTAVRFVPLPYMTQGTGPQNNPAFILLTPQML